MVKFNLAILSSNYNALLIQFLLFPEAGQLLTLAIMYSLCWFSYFSCSRNRFLLHLGAWEIILLFGQQCLRSHAPLTSFPHCLVCASQGLRTDCHLLYHISLGYSMCSALWLCGDILDATSFHTIMVSHFAFRSWVSVFINWWNLFWSKSLHFGRSMW